jgi:hypothetical protein
MSVEARTGTQLCPEAWSARKKARRRIVSAASRQSATFGRGTASSRGHSATSRGHSAKGSATSSQVAERYECRKIFRQGPCHSATCSDCSATNAGRLAVDRIKGSHTKTWVRDNPSRRASMVHVYITSPRPFATKWVANSIAAQRDYLAERPFVIDCAYLGMFYFNVIAHLSWLKTYAYYRSCQIVAICA